MSATTTHKSPRRSAWCERSSTRAGEIKALASWAVTVDDGRPGWTAADRQEFKRAIDQHVQRANEAIARTGNRLHGMGASIDQAMSSLDAAEAELLYMAPAEYVVGQLPSIVNNVGRHLQPTDPRRLEVERIAREVATLSRGIAQNSPLQAGIRTPGGRAWPPPPPQRAHGRTRSRSEAVVDENRSTIVGATRGASSVALREQIRVRSFRNVVAAAAGAMFLVAAGLILLGIFSPTTIPLCFAPEELNQVTVVCPTGQSGPIEPIDGQSSVSATRIDDEMKHVVSSWDVAIVSIVGATGASVAAAAALRQIRGSSEPYGVPIALALLKIPTGAVTAVLGLTLMRGGFVPGLSALDTSAQILAWAAVFGYAQQLFTRLVDQQAHAVLDGVRGADKATDPKRSS
jgi:hypothetical protein